VDSTSVLYGPRCLLGTNSPRTTENESCLAAAGPLTVFAAINVFTLWAEAPIMLLTRASTHEPVKNQRRPKTVSILVSSSCMLAGSLLAHYQRVCPPA
jgi:hypothetical protein